MRLPFRLSSTVLRKLRAALRLACVALAMPLLLAACAPEVGSEAWCKQIEEKGVGNITANEAADYARHCVLQ
jgi:hypothetical protein